MGKFAENLDLGKRVLPPPPHLVIRNIPLSACIFIDLQSCVSWDVRIVMVYWAINEFDFWVLLQSGYIFAEDLNVINKKHKWNCS